MQHLHPPNPSSPSRCGEGFGYKMHSSPALMPGPAHVPLLSSPSTAIPHSPRHHQPLPCCPLGLGTRWFSWCLAPVAASFLSGRRRDPWAPSHPPTPPPPALACAVCAVSGLWAKATPAAPQRHPASGMEHTCACHPPPQSQAGGPVLTWTQLVHRQALELGPGHLPLTLSDLLTDLRQWCLQTLASPLSWQLWPGLVQGLVGLGLGLGLQEQPVFPSRQGWQLCA